MDAPTQRPPIVPKCVFSTAEESVLYALRGRHWEAPPPPPFTFPAPYPSPFSDEDPLMLLCAQLAPPSDDAPWVGARPARAV